MSTRLRTLRALLRSFSFVLLLLLVRPPLAASAAPDMNASLTRVLELTNIERSKVGAPPLKLSTELNSAAQAYSQVLASSDCFAHTCGPVPEMADRMGQAGYQNWTALGENIAAGYSTPEAVVAGWMGSPGHRDNLLSPSFSEIGLGLALGGGYGTFWTQDFGTRPTVAAAPAPEPEPEVANADEAPPAEDE
jgi:uncharacterized protein YkwD